MARVVPARPALLLAALCGLVNALPAAAGPAVPIRGLAFPPEVAVGAGEEVIWTHEDGTVPHDVVSGAPGEPDAGRLFASPLLRSGEVFRVTFERAGAYDYFCSLHPSMRGTVIVTDGAAGPEGG